MAASTKSFISISRFSTERGLSSLISPKLLSTLIIVVIMHAQLSRQAAIGDNSTAIGDERFQLGGKCIAKSSCKMQRSRRLEVDSGQDKRSCNCDIKCQLYDDCCSDSQWTESMSRRVAGGLEKLRETRNQWHCHRVNPIFGDILFKASCSDEWLRVERTSKEDRELAERIQRNCAHIRNYEIKQNVSHPPSPADDPLGMMLPITDLSSGITYANSYCLRCNRLQIDKQQQQPPRLNYWSPMLECNYDVDNDDRNTLFDLISAHKGRVLQYSSERNKWLIKMDHVSPQDNKTSSATVDDRRDKKINRECNITPTVPDAIEHMIRYCKANTIHTCPKSTVIFSADQKEELDRARLECQYGHQSIVYSQTSGAVYYNLACAKCNNEKQVFCEPRVRKSGFATNVRVVVPGRGKNNSDMTLWSPPDDISGGEASPEGLDTDAARSTSAGRGTHLSTAISGSFSVLLDLYGAWHGDEQVGAVHQCPDAQNQVFDPFFLTCRDIVCGLNHRYVEGRCVSVKTSPEDNLHVKVIGPMIDANGTTYERQDNRPVNGTVQEDNDSQKSGQPSTQATGKLVNQQQGSTAAEGLVAVDSTSSLRALMTSTERSTTGEPINATARLISLVETPENIVTAPQLAANSTNAARIVDDVKVIGDEELSLAPPSDKQPAIMKDGNEDVENTMTTTSELPMNAKLSETTATSLLAQPETANFTETGPAQVTTGSGGGATTGDSQRMKDDRAEFAAEGHNSTNLPQPVEGSIMNGSPSTSATTKPVTGEFEAALADLNASDLPQPTVESRRAFVECGKILIQPKHYRLFTTVIVDEADDAATTTLTPSKTESADQQPNSGYKKILLLTLDEWEHRQQQHKPKPATEGNKLWAFVVPYNLTLASSQFELVRSSVELQPADDKTRADVSGEQQRRQQEFKLLVCSPFRSDLVAKFEPTMAYLTTVCLIVSITSLSMYLLLYCLSMFDLRNLVVEMVQAGQLAAMMGNNPLADCKLRGSQASNELANSSGSTATRSQSLSSRGVACLAGSLLAAYLLFILGHQRAADVEEDDGTKPQPMLLLSCANLAAATYYCFLVAFNWMFLLSYDIWRTLRLATCQLRGPVLHSQSKRFIIYTVVAFGASALIGGSALLVNHLEPLNCEQSEVQKCDETKTKLDRFIQMYRPRFGQQAGSCWFHNRRALALFFGLPVTLVMTVNLIFFLHSSYMIVKTSSSSTRRINSATSSSGASPPISRNKQPSAVFTCKTSIDKQNQDQLQHDYTQQNSLTTSSLISVQTCQSTLSDSSRGSSLVSNQTVGSSRSEQLAAPEGAPSQQRQFERANSFKCQTGSPQDSAEPHSVMDSSGNGHFNCEQNSADGRKRKLEPSQSSSSIVTNHSVGATSLANSIAAKYDTHLHNLSSMMGSIVKDYRLYCRLSTIMGLTWLTGLMASLVDQSGLLWYLFVVLNTLQGLFIFIAFGCKRSKLSNLEILLHYIQFRWMLLSQRFKDNKKPEQLDAKETTAQSICTGCKVGQPDDLAAAE